MDRGSPGGCSPEGRTESNTNEVTEQAHFKRFNYSKFFFKVHLFFKPVSGTL